MFTAINTKTNPSIANYSIALVFLTTFSLTIVISCKRVVEIGEPINTITSSETYNSESTAESAIVGIYNSIDLQYASYGNGLITLYTGLSSDELNFFAADDIYTMQFQTNTLDPTNGNVTNFWTPAYTTIYRANAAIEGLSKSPMLASKKNQLLGEAKFLRAFAFFYLTNLFGDVPLVITTDWEKNAVLERAPQSNIYDQIIADLKDAQNLLTEDYIAPAGERTRVNKSSAAALLARAYLYKGDYIDAALQATSVINNAAMYSLVPNPDSVFLVGSTEAIWQLQTYNTYPFATIEGSRTIPYINTINPDFYLTPQLLSSFEDGDRRKTSWLDSSTYESKVYYYPFKYKVRVGTENNITEYYMVLRLAEQYLIRAESLARQNTNLKDAISDINIIRGRAGLDSLPDTMSQDGVISAVAQERRIELFSEWGHRWFDLKRTNRADIVLQSIKPAWKNTAQLYPIPYSEIRLSPKLSQNQGYY